MELLVLQQGCNNRVKQPNYKHVWARTCRPIVPEASQDPHWLHNRFSCMNKEKIGYIYSGSLRFYGSLAYTSIITQLDPLQCIISYGPMHHCEKNLDFNVVYENLDFQTKTRFSFVAFTNKNLKNQILVIAVQKNLVLNRDYKVGQRSPMKIRIPINYFDMI